MPPSLVFALILAITVGLLFHSIFGRRVWQLPLFLASAAIGLIGGQVAGTLMAWDTVHLGSITVLPAVGGSLIALWICWFFTAPLHDHTTNTRRRARRAVRGRSAASA